MIGLIVIMITIFILVAGHGDEKQYDEEEREKARQLGKFYYRDFKNRTRVVETNEQCYITYDSRGWNVIKDKDFKVIKVIPNKNYVDYLRAGNTSLLNEYEKMKK